MQHRHIQDEHDLEEILRIAIRKDSGGTDLRQRLESIAQEAGISEEALRQAEQEWLEERERRQKELARVEYLKQSRSLWNSAGGMLLPIGLVLIMDLVPDWTLGWSLIPAAALAVIAVYHALDERFRPLDEKKFEAWYKKRSGVAE